MAAITEDEAYEASKGPNQSIPHGEDPLYYVQPCSSRHGKCYSPEKGAFGGQTWISLFENGDYLINQEDRITMCSMLGTCRQIYEEAYRLFWLSNTFSFDEPHSLGEFFGSLTLSQKRHFTNLHISCRVQNEDEFYVWNIADNVFKSMSGLRTLHLCVEIRYIAGHDYEWTSQDNSWLLSKATHPWLPLRTSPLANVTVVISDERSHLQKHNLMRYRWTVLEKKRMAATIRADIINEEAVAHARQRLTDSRAFKNQRRRQLKQQRKTQQVGASGARQMTGIGSSLTDGGFFDVPMNIVEGFERQKLGYTLPSQSLNPIASPSLEREDDQQKLVRRHGFDGLSKSHGSFDTFQQEEHAWVMAQPRGYYDELELLEHSVRQDNTRQGSNDFDYPHAARHTQIQRPESVGVSHGPVYVGSCPPIGGQITNRYVGNCPPIGGQITNRYVGNCPPIGGQFTNRYVGSCPPIGGQITGRYVGSYPPVGGRLTDKHVGSYLPVGLPINDNKFPSSSTNYALLPVQRGTNRHNHVTQQIPNDAHHRAVNISNNPYGHTIAGQNLPSVSTSLAPSLHGGARQHGGGHLHDGFYHPYARRFIRWGQHRAPDVPTTEDGSSGDLEAFGGAGTPG